MFFLQDEKKINHLLFYNPWTQGNLLIASQVCRWSHKRLPPAFYLYLSFICDVITMAVREQLGMWAGGRIYLCFSQAQDLDFVPDSLEQNWICGNFPTIVKVITSHYNGRKNSHRYSSAPVNLGQNPDPVPEKSINISCHQLTSSVALWLPWW